MGIMEDGLEVERQRSKEVMEKERERRGESEG